MSLFSRLAGAFHQVERVFAGLHTSWWFVKNRNQTVLVQYKNMERDRGSEGVKIHDPERQERHNPGHHGWEEMSLKKASGGEGGYLCQSCFNEAFYKPHPV